MKKVAVSFFCILFFLCVSVTVKAQSPPLYKFEGRAMKLESSANLETGNYETVSYGTSTGTNKVKVYLSPSHTYASNQSAITKCDNTGSQTITSSTPAQVDTTTYGKFCFKSNDPVFKIDVKDAFGSSTSIIYDRWIADQPTVGTSSSINYPYSYPYSTGYYNVKDFGAKGDSTTDDTAAIKNAVTFIASKQGGTLFFPQGDYLITDSIPLVTGLVVQGVSGISSEGREYYDDVSKTFSRIKIQSSTSTAIFRVGLNTKDVKLKNLVLKNEKISEAYPDNDGIRARGKNHVCNPPAQCFDWTVQRIGLNDVTFERLRYGFYVEATDGQWQFDYLRLDHCYFIYNKLAGVFVNTANSDWKITNTNFFMPAWSQSVNSGDNADAIRIVNADSVLVENTFSGGNSEAIGQRGGDFIDADTIGALTVINSATERSSRSLNYGGNGYATYSYPVTLINNVFGDKIQFNSYGTFVSMGNLYGANTFVYFPSGVTPVPLLSNYVRIYSMGDRFCYDSTGGGCKKNYDDPVNAPLVADFFGGQIMFSTGQPQETFGTPTVTIPGRNPVMGTMNDGTSAMLELRYSQLVSGTKNTFSYTLKRDATNGWLSFEGSQSMPYKGYLFDAPVKLPSYDYNTLINGTLGTATPGTVVYCNNCLEGTSPCQSGGTGTVAVLKGTLQRYSGNVCDFHSRHKFDEPRRS